MSKITKLARSPQGQKAIAEAQRRAKDPKTRKQIDDVRRRLMSRGRRP